MMEKPNCPIIALEEHYLDQELVAHVAGGSGHNVEISKRLYDLGELRLKEMDEAGIDVQVLSHGAPSGQMLPKDIAVDLTRRANDRLHAAIDANPKRFAAFAILPTSDPASAAGELERTVEKLGFKGAMISGFVDDKCFWPIFARAEKLDVPIYLHPPTPHPAVIDAYYKDYIKDFPTLVGPAWGYAVEGGTQAIRLVVSGVFDAYPRLKIILGHLGEGLPFMVWRVDQSLLRPGQKRMNFRDVFCNNFYITTSGNFSNPALLCCVMEMGIDRIMFGVDWPFAKNLLATRWTETVPLCDEDKVKILSGNAKRLLRM